MTENPKCKRHWFRYSLRSLLIFVTIVGCALGWLGMKFREAKKQENAVRSIRKIGGIAKYDYEFSPSVGEPPNLARRVPKWLCEKMGEDLFENIYEVDLSGHTVTDADMETLGQLVQLRRLWLDDTDVTDVGVEQIKNLHQLEDLSLRETKVTDSGLERLKRLNALRDLDLTSTRVTDAGLEHVRGFTKLEMLWLRQTNVTDVGLACLKGLDQLQGLYLDGTRVSDAGLGNLTGLKHLDRVTLKGTRVTDAGAAKLQKELPSTIIGG
jgi:Leucine-rich repeat (LRR) protein